MERSTYELESEYDDWLSKSTTVAVENDMGSEVCRLVGKEAEEEEEEEEETAEGERRRHHKSSR